MKVEQDLHMAGGDGENSYATNSRLQEKAMLETRPVLQSAVVQLYASLPPGSTMVVADLGCSSGPNTLLLVSEVIGTISDYSRETGRDAVEAQFFLNDLPGNDFNLVFRSLDQLTTKLTAAGENNAEKATVAAVPMYYVAGMPGSFYTRLFPCRSVHLFHSSYSLMWRSKGLMEFKTKIQLIAKPPMLPFTAPRTNLMMPTGRLSAQSRPVPDELSRGTCLNEESIYIGKNTSSDVIKLYQEGYQKDLTLFLTLRFKELVCGGYMVLTFLGRKSGDMLLHGEVSSMWDLLAQALLSLVWKGRVEKEKLVSFNLPFYAPSMDEVKDVIEGSGLFGITHIGLFESSWDPQDDDADDAEVLDCARSGANVAKCIRAVVEPLIKEHFGFDEAILDELFVVYASMVAKHLQKSKAKYPIIVVSLKAKN